MSAVAEAPTSPLLESALAAVEKLSAAEKTWLMARVKAELDEEFPAWQMEIVKERLRMLDEGKTKPIPLTEALVELDAKWSRKS